MLTKVRAWVEERTGLESAIGHMLNEDIPASSGWHQVFGSMAVFMFLVQVFTGIMMALNYAPTTSEAHSSLRYILTELTAGRLMRGLHHWGASMMIVIVVLHMLQVFIWGAYKKPREATWMLGVVLLLLTLGFGLTGYLLPWDNRAYWGTVVTTQIAAKAPGMGPYILTLLGSEGGQIGAVTFARFYGAHVLMLPAITALLIFLHVYLVRKHGAAPAPVETAPPIKFYPRQVFKDTVAIFFTFAILFTLAVAVRVPLGKLADPTDVSFIPRPEWYFLFLFQILKYFEGPLEIVGSMILPGIAVMLLFATPFIDRGAMIKVRQRTGAIGVLLLCLIGWGGLTGMAMKATPHRDPWKSFTAEEMAAIGNFRRANCWQCHATSPGESRQGPNLADIAVHRDKEWLVNHFKTSSPDKSIRDIQWKQLANFLPTLDDENVESLHAAPQTLVYGATVYQQNNCGACHQINRAGMKSGPPLNGVAKRWDRKWMEEHFIDPEEKSPGTIMPAYKFSPADMTAILDYMMFLTE